MILHLVAFRFRPGTPASAVAEAGAALLAMKGRVPEIQDIRWTPNLAPNTAEYSHVLTVLLEDMAAVERYGAHPVHQDVIRTVLAPIREARLALDFEVPPTR